MHLFKLPICGLRFSLFSTDIVDFNIPINEEGDAKDAADKLKEPYKRNADVRAGRKTEAQLNIERQALAKKYPAKARGKAVTKRKLRAEALGLTPDKQTAFDDARKTLGSTKTQRAAIRKHLAVITDSKVSPQAREEANRQLNKVVKSPEELRKIREAYETIAKTRIGAKPVAAKGNTPAYKTKPVGNKSTAIERALQGIKGAESEFIVPGTPAPVPKPPRPVTAAPDNIKPTKKSVKNVRAVQRNNNLPKLGTDKRFDALASGQVTQQLIDTGTKASTPAASVIPPPARVSIPKATKKVKEAAEKAAPKDTRKGLEKIKDWVKEKNWFNQLEADKVANPVWRTIRDNKLASVAVAGGGLLAGRAIYKGLTEPKTNIYYPPQDRYNQDTYY